MELISVIVPVYKVEPYIAKCVDSILAQTYRELEVILVDDGSPDACGSICDDYARRDARVRVVHKPNGGLSDARNAGLDIARGEYLAFVDSDDYIHPRMIEALYGAMQKGADMAIGGYRRVREDDVPESADIQCVCHWYTQREALHNLFDPKLGEMTTVAWNKLYKRKLFQTVRYPVGRNFEDAAVIHELLALTESVVYIDDILYYYLQRRDSIVYAQNYAKCAPLQSIHDRKEFFEKLGDEELCQKARAGYLRRIIWQYNRIAKYNADEKAVLASLYKEYKKCYAEGMRGARGAIKLYLAGFYYWPKAVAWLWRKLCS